MLKVLAMNELINSMHMHIWVHACMGALARQNASTYIPMICCLENFLDARSVQLQTEGFRVNQPKPDRPIMYVHVMHEAAHLSSAVLPTFLHRVELIQTASPETNPKGCSCQMASLSRSHIITASMTSTITIAMHLVRKCTRR